MGVRLSRAAQDIDMIIDFQGIYCIRNKLDNKRYIGSSVHVNCRRRRHMSMLEHNEHHSKHLQQSYNKYGPDMFVFEILELIENTNILKEREQFWINKYKSYDNIYGYNIAICSDNATRGRHLTLEHRQKLSNVLKGRKLTQEHIDNVVKANIGKKRSALTKTKISQALIGRKHTIEEKENISRGLKNSGRIYSKNYKLSLEHKEKIKKSMRVLASNKLLWKQKQF